MSRRYATALESYERLNHPITLISIGHIGPNLRFSGYITNSCIVSVVEFLGFAKIALKDTPELYEMFGDVVPS